MTGCTTTQVTCYRNHTAYLHQVGYNQGFRGLKMQKMKWCSPIETIQNIGHHPHPYCQGRARLTPLCGKSIWRYTRYTSIRSLPNCDERVREGFGDGFGRWAWAGPGKPVEGHAGEIHPKKVAGKLLGPVQRRAVPEVHLVFGVIPSREPSEMHLILSLSPPEGFGVNDGSRA